METPSEVGYIVDYIGKYCRVLKGDTRSLDYTSRNRIKKGTDTEGFPLLPEASCTHLSRVMSPNCCDMYPKRLRDQISQSIITNAKELCVLPSWEYHGP